VSLAKELFTAEDTLLVMCRSGSRSARAVNLLAEGGFKNVYNVIDGMKRPGGGLTTSSTAAHETAAIRAALSYRRSERMLTQTRKGGTTSERISQTG
jgi:hypothetical protein